MSSNNNPVYLEIQTSKETIFLKALGSLANQNITTKELAKSLMGQHLTDDTYIISANFITKEQYDSQEADWTQTEPIDHDGPDRPDEPGSKGGDTV